MQIKFSYYCNFILNLWLVFVKFYNTAAASVVIGKTTIVKTLQVPSSGSVVIKQDVAMQNFDTAISIAATKLIADNDTTAITTDIYAEIFYN